MKVKITTWFDTEEESGCCTTELYEDVKTVWFEDQTNIENGIWLNIQLEEKSKQYKKFEDMRGLVIINIDYHDEVIIF